MITLPMFARQITLRDFATRPNSFTTIVLQALGSLFQLCSLYNQALTASSCETPGVSAPRRWARSRAKLPSPLFLITCLQLSRFQRVPHSFVQRSASYSRVFNGLRTLLTSTGVVGGSLNLVHRDSAQKLGVKVSGLLWQDFSRRGDSHHLLHIASIQKERDLRRAAIHRIHRRRSFAFISQILLGGDCLRRDAQGWLQNSFMQQYNVKFALQWGNIGQQLR